MGSSKRPKPKGQPPKAQAPGRAGEGGVSVVERLPDQLKIALVRVDRAVAESASRGSPISVRRRGDGFSVYSVGRRLGDIPPRFSSSLEDGYRSGTIRDLSTTPLRVVVLLNR